MRRYFLALVGLMALFAVSACSTTSQTRVDEALASENVQTGIQLACATYEGIKLGYDAYVEGREVKPEVKKKVDLAVAAVGSFCTPPYPNSTASLVAKVTIAGVQVIQALKEQQKVDAETSP